MYHCSTYRMKQIQYRKRSLHLSPGVITAQDSGSKHCITPGSRTKAWLCVIFDFYIYFTVIVTLHRKDTCDQLNLCSLRFSSDVKRCFYQQSQPIILSQNTYQPLRRHFLSSLMVYNVITTSNKARFHISSSPVCTQLSCGIIDLLGSAFLV